MHDVSDASERYLDARTIARALHRSGEAATFPGHALVIKPEECIPLAFRGGVRGPRLRLWILEGRGSIDEGGYL